jgi:two-component system, response regulator PdtaR
MPPDLPTVTTTSRPTPVILIVEDVADLRSSVSEYFRTVGFDVVAAENAQEALNIIRSGIHIDLVFTDVNMPGAMDGVALAQWLSVDRPGVPTILTSGELCPEIPRSAPHRRFVRKPYMLDELEHEIRKLIATSPFSIESRQIPAIQEGVL